LRALRFFLCFGDDGPRCCRLTFVGGNLQFAADIDLIGTQFVDLADFGQRHIMALRDFLQRFTFLHGVHLPRSLVGRFTRDSERFFLDFGNDCPRRRITAIIGNDNQTTADSHFVGAQVVDLTNFA
jgi:hypothetical protein